MIIKGLIILIASTLVAWLTTRELIRVLSRRGIMDVPNRRSSHKAPTPRGGGIGILAGLAIALLIGMYLKMPLPQPEIIIGALIIALIGFLDDRLGGLSPLFRFFCQAIAAGLVIWKLGGLNRLPLSPPFDFQLGILAVPFALIWILALTNLYNFLDGIDGFAGLQGIIAGLALTCLGGSDVFLATGLAIAGACGGFLLHNWHPARIFMGDVGSGTLGFLLASLPFQLNFPERSDGVLVISMFLWFFISDGVFTIALRLTRREKIWQPHCSHLYQRLVRTGLSHSHVALRVGLAAAAIAALTVISIQLQQPTTIWIVQVLAICSFLLYLQWTRHMEAHASYRKESVESIRATSPITLKSPTAINGDSSTYTGEGYAKDRLKENYTFSSTKA